MSLSSAVPATVEDRLRAALADLTRAERQLATHVLSHYPVAALGSITVLAKAAQVSTPTVVRLAQKIGFKGYPEFQAALRVEVEAMLVSPLTKHERAGRLAEGHVLARMAGAAVENLEGTLGQVDQAAFDAAAALLAEPARKVFVLGGRITHALADYLTSLLAVIRPGVTLLSDNSTTWPPALLDMGEGDVLVVFDIRRYENAVLNLAEMAAEQGVRIVLVTDRWVSPAATHAAHVLPCHIEAPSAWDSLVAPLLLVESLMAAVQDLIWPLTEARMKRLEAHFSRARLFRRTK